MVHAVPSVRNTYATPGLCVAAPDRLPTTALSPCSDTDRPNELPPGGAGDSVSFVSSVHVVPVRRNTYAAPLAPTIAPLPWMATAHPNCPNGAPSLAVSNACSLHDAPSQ